MMTSKEFNELYDKVKRIDAFEIPHPDPQTMSEARENTVARWANFFVHEAERDAWEKVLKSIGRQDEDPIAQKGN